MAQLELSEAYKRDLLGQIQAHREADRAERQAYLEEGKRIRQNQMREKALLETVSILPPGTSTSMHGLVPVQTASSQAEYPRC